MMSGTPKEIADALIEETTRPLWDANLLSVERRDTRTLILHYHGVSKPVTLEYDFEMLASSQGRQQKQFIIHESNILMDGIKKRNKIFILEEITNRPYCMRVTMMTNSDKESDCRTYIK